MERYVSSKKAEFKLDKRGRRVKVKPNGKLNMGGRPVGSMNKLTKEIRERAAKSGELPHDFLLRCMREGKIEQPKRKGKAEVVYLSVEERIAAAKAAAPYFAPKLAALHIDGRNAPPVLNIPPEKLHALKKEDLLVLDKVLSLIYGFEANTAALIDMRQDPTDPSVYEAER